MKNRLLLTAVVLIVVLLINTNGCSASPKHNIPEKELTSDTAYRNTAWVGREEELNELVFSVADALYKNVCIRNSSDGNQRAADLWNMLDKKSITPVIAAGNLEMTGETFDRFNHSWIMIFYDHSHLVVEPDDGNVYIPQNDGLYFRAPGQVTFSGKAPDDLMTQYLEAWYYASPSDFKEDIRERW